MCPETSYRTLQSRNIKLNGCYRQVAPPEQKYACCVSFSFNQTYIINPFLISNPRYYRHSTPLECDSLNAPFSIEIAPLRGEESAKKTLLKRSKLVSSNLGYKNPSL